MPHLHPTHMVFRGTLNQAPSGMPLRFAASGVWYDPAAGPPPARAVGQRSKLSRKLAALRVRERREAKKQTEIWSSDDRPTGSSGGGSSGSERLSPTNPLRPRGSLPFKPDRSSSMSPPKPKRRGVALPLESVGSLSDTAARSPVTNKASSRSARGTARGSARNAKQEAKMLAAKKGLAALAGDEATRADAETPDKPANAAASTGLRRKERKSEESFKSDGDSMEMRAIAKLELSAAALHEIADGFERTASSNQAMAGSRESLHVALGTRLMEKADKKGGQAFFRELDVNGDGSVTRIEFKQMMRKLGLLGEGSSFDAKAVDDLFSELDADGGGELDLGEILAALKKLKARVLAVERQEAVAQAEADNWRARAEQTRRAAERVAEKEVIASELHELRFNPSVEWRLATLLSKAQLKPAEVLTKFDGNIDGKIDQGEFAKGFLSLRIDATVEELHELHGKLDTVRRHARALSRSRGLQPLQPLSAPMVPVRVASLCAHAPSTTAIP